MLKNISKLEIYVEGKVYQFLCDPDAQLVHAKEALFQFQKYIGQVEDAIKAQQQKEASVDKPAQIQEEPKQEASNG